MESTKRKLLANPRKSANIFSVLFFTWTIPIFKNSFNKELDTDDVYEPLSVDQSSELGNRLDA